MLHPKQFQVNEAWIAFQLSDKPVHTVQDGDYHFLALMDAASCFILSSAPVWVSQAEIAPLESKRLLSQGRAHKKRWPKTLFIPEELSVPCLLAEAERVGIQIVRVKEQQIMPFIGDAQEGFSEHFGLRGSQ